MKKNQSGSTLAISLVLLTAITVMAVIGMERSGLQSKIVANIQHKENTYNVSKTVIYDGFNHIDDFQNFEITGQLSQALEIATQHKYLQSIGVTEPDLPEMPIPLKIGSPILTKEYFPNEDRNYQFQLPLDIDINVQSPFITPSLSLRPVLNDNPLGNPNASGLRDGYTRGDGAGVAKFDLESNALLPNAIASRQLLGLNVVLPTQ